MNVFGMDDSLKALVRLRPAGRYAPSPTGDLHLGNLRMALAARDDARHHGSAFILRMEDTDLPRNRPGAAEHILDDLAWLGIQFDEGPHLPPPGGPAGPYLQSQRHPIYLQALGQLARAGLLYPCTCSRQVLESAASAPHGPEPARYPGTCRRVPDADEIATLLRTVEQATLLPRPTAMPWSLRLNTESLPPAAFYDELQGHHHVTLASSGGDFVLFRRDGLWAYQFVCAVDDALMGITRVIRGADLLSSTPRQVALMQALGFAAPVYRHLPLVGDPDTGHRLSKRDGSASLKSFRLIGLSPDDVREIICQLPEIPL